MGHSATVQPAAVCAVCRADLHGPPAVRLGLSSLQTCPSCNSWTWLPRLSSADQAAIHDTGDYFAHPYFEGRRRLTPAHFRRCRRLLTALAPLVNLTDLRGERWLDVGCDTGAFLQALQQEIGIVPVGMDISRRAIEVAREQGIEAYNSSVETAPAELAGFRIVSAVDLIEHVHDPAAFLRAIRGRLRPGGILYVETPNILSRVYGFGRVWAGLSQSRPASLIERLFPAQHVQYFTPSSLRLLAEREGFEVAQMWTRVLPAADTSASLAVLLAMAGLQTLDRLFGTHILLCAALRRTSSNGGPQ